jgi:hypothetical protein
MGPVEEYWVVGGTYRDASFAALSESGGEVYGPFATYDDAFHLWRERAADTRSQATVRYSVVVTAPRRARH